MRPATAHADHLIGDVDGRRNTKLPPFEGHDPDGVIRVAIDPDLLYDLGAFIANSGWPCPGFVSEDATTFHFSPNGTYTPGELRAGVTFVIAVPSPEDCAT